MAENNLSPPEFFGAIASDNVVDGGMLTYSSLLGTAGREDRITDQRLAAAWESGSGTQTEYQMAQYAAYANLVRTAAQTVVATEVDVHDTWADRFTEGSVELFGRPEAVEARRILRNRYHGVAKMQGQDGVDQDIVHRLMTFLQPVCDTGPEYAPDVSSDTALDTEEQYADMVFQELGEVVRRRYEPLFKPLDEASPDTKFNARHVVELFGTALEWLAEHDDPAWQEWKLVTPPDDAAFSVHAPLQRISIGMRLREQSVAEVKEFIAHELLGHGLRAKNSHKYDLGESRLATEATDSGVFEEGYAAYLGYAVSGTLKSDRLELQYACVALALGDIGGRRYTRQELFDLNYALCVVENQADGTYGRVLSEDQDNELRRIIWTRVNRLFEGGRGDAFGQRQSVLTYDNVYHRGYLEAKRSIEGLRRQGMRMDAIFDLLSAGEFDLTVPQQADLARELVSANSR